MAHDYQNASGKGRKEAKNQLQSNVNTYQYTSFFISIIITIGVATLHLQNENKPSHMVSWNGGIDFPFSQTDGLFDNLTVTSVVKLASNLIRLTTEAALHHLWSCIFEFINFECKLPHTSNTSSEPWEPPPSCVGRTEKFRSILIDLGNLRREMSGLGQQMPRHP